MHWSQQIGQQKWGTGIRDLGHLSVIAGSKGGYSIELHCVIRPPLLQPPVHSGHPSGPNQLAAIERWPDYTVYSGHPSGPNQLAAIERWPDYTVYSGHPSGPNQLAAIERWPDYTVYSGHPSGPNQLRSGTCWVGTDDLVAPV